MSAEGEYFPGDGFGDRFGRESVFLADLCRGTVRDDLVGVPAPGEQGRTAVPRGELGGDGRQTALFHVVLQRDDRLGNIFPEKLRIKRLQELNKYIRKEKKDDDEPEKLTEGNGTGEPVAVAGEIR